MFLAKTIHKYIKIGLLLILLLSLSVSKNAHAQQWVIDDAAITTYRSFQIESWYGEMDSYFLPAVSPLPFLELSAGICLATRQGFELSHWLFETKIVPGDFEQSGSAAGISLGIELSPGMVFQTFYANLPYTFQVFANKGLIHANIGYLVFQNSRWNHEAFYGLRLDYQINQYVLILSEVFATNLNLPGFQAGLRIILKEGLLEADISWGRGLKEGIKTPGLNIGIAFTPDALW